MAPIRVYRTYIYIICIIYILNAVDTHQLSNDVYRYLDHHNCSKQQLEHHTIDFCVEINGSNKSAAFLQHTQQKLKRRFLGGKVGRKPQPTICRVLPQSVCARLCCPLFSLSNPHAAIAREREETQSFDRSYYIHISIRLGPPKRKSPNSPKCRFGEWSPTRVVAPRLYVTSPPSSRSFCSVCLLHQSTEQQREDFPPKLHCCLLFSNERRCSVGASSRETAGNNERSLRGEWRGGDGGVLP